MAKLVNRAGMTVTGTPGTGTITLNAAIATPKKYLSLTDAGVENANVVSYLIEDGAEFEHGTGTYTLTGTTLTRDTVRKSSNAGLKISATAAALVYIDAGAEDIEQAATDTVAGRVELATSAETITGTDATRAVTPAGLAAASWTMVMKTSDTSRASTTTTSADPALQFSMAASTNYVIRIVAKVNTNATADFKWGLAGPASPTEVFGSGSFTWAANVFAAFTAYPTNQALVSSSVAGGVMGIEVTVENGLNTGTFSFDWAQNASDAGATLVKAGSYLEYRTY